MEAGSVLILFTGIIIGLVIGNFCDKADDRATRRLQ
jgi:hypothetical protein